MTTATKTPRTKAAKAAKPRITPPAANPTTLSASKARAAKVPATSARTPTVVPSATGRTASFPALLTTAVAGYLPELRKLKAAEITPPDGYLADKSLAYRQRMFRSACLELAGLLEANDPAERRRLGDRVRTWTRTNVQGEPTSEGVAQGVRACFGDAAIAMAARKV